MPIASSKKATPNAKKKVPEAPTMTMEISMAPAPAQDVDEEAEEPSEEQLRAPTEAIAESYEYTRPYMRGKLSKVPAAV